MRYLIAPFKRISGLAVAILLAYLFTVPSPLGAVFAYDYDYTYTYTNIYWDFEIDYDFTNLDATSTYTWTVQGLAADGSVLKTLKVDSAVEVATAHFVITASMGGSYWQGPLRVIDNFGKILGYHYSVFSPTGSDFYNDCLDRDFGDRTVAVSTLHYFTNYICEDAILFPTPTIYHRSSALLTTVAYGDYLLMHFALSDPAATDTVIVIHDIAATTDTPIATISLYDATCYNDTIGSSYFPLATGGALPFVDHDTFDSCWVNGDNPTSLVLPVGAYEYAKIYDNDTVPDSYAGESTFIVTASPNATAWGDTASQSPAYLSIYPTVAENEQQLVDAFVYESAVWDGYSTIGVYDSDMAAYVHTVDYTAEYIPHIRFTYTVAGTPGNTSNTILSLKPTATRYDRALDYYGYVVYGTYDILAAPTRSETWRGMLERNGWTDPPQAVLFFFVLLAIVAGGFGSLAPGSMLLVGSVAYIILGVAFVYLGLFGLLLTSIWIVGIIPAVVLSWSGGSNAGTE